MYWAQRKEDEVGTSGSGDTDTLRQVQRALTHLLAEFDRVCNELDLAYVAYGGTAIGAVRHHGFIPWDDDADVCMPRADYERFLAEAPAKLSDGISVINSRNTSGYPNMFSKLALPGTLFISVPMRDNPFRMPIALDIFPLDTMPQDPRQYRRQVRATWFWGRLLYLQGTGRPYLEIDGAKKHAVLAATQLVHLALALLRVRPEMIQGRWERAARRFEGSHGSRMTDYTDRDPMAWAVTPDDLFPPLEVPFEDITVKIPREYDAVLTRGYGDYMELPPVDKRKTHEPVRVDLGDFGSRSAS